MMHDFSRLASRMRAQATTYFSNSKMLRTPVFLRNGIVLGVKHNFSHYDLEFQIKMNIIAK